MILLHLLLQKGYSFKVMPFGLRNSPASFQRLMNHIIVDLHGCAVYLDDVVIYSDTWDFHLECLWEIFTRLVEARLTVNLAKCKFARATMNYLGYVVGQEHLCSIIMLFVQKCVIL